MNVNTDLTPSALSPVKSTLPSSRAVAWVDFIRRLRTRFKCWVYQSAVAKAGIAVAVVSTLGLSACNVLPQAAADPTRYYVLSGPAPSEMSTRVAAEGMAIAIRSVELPNYLKNTRNIVVRKGGNEIRFEDFARWAEPIEAGLTRALKERLAGSPQVRSVVVFPLMASDARQYDLRVRVTRCEGGTNADGSTVVLFSAVYEFSTVDGDGQVVVRKTFTAPESPWDGKDFAALAESLSRAVGMLSTEIADNLPAS